MMRLLAPIAMPVLRYATRSYITGPELSDAMHFANAATERGFKATTLCYWNDGKEDPRLVADRYVRSLQAMRAESLESDLALKMPALWDRRDLVREVVTCARQLGVRTMFDSHAAAQADQIFAMMEELGGSNIGCAIPGRWRRSLADVERAVGLGIAVRVVKGQWDDPDYPGCDLREGFLGVIDALAGRAVRVAIASHDAPLVGEAIRRLQAAGTPCEVELLFGLPIGPAETVARNAGVTLRLYIPYGSAWLPYSVSRAFANPRILMWLARDLVSGRGKKLPPPTSRPNSPPGASA